VIYRFGIIIIIIIIIIDCARISISRCDTSVSSWLYRKQNGNVVPSLHRRGGRGDGRKYVSVWFITDWGHWRARSVTYSLLCAN